MSHNHDHGIPDESSGARRPANIRMKVVFPVPFSPNMTMISESLNSPAIMSRWKSPAYKGIGEDERQVNVEYYNNTVF